MTASASTAKVVTRKTYDLYPRHFQGFFDRSFQENRIQRFMDHFTKHLPRHARVVDLGAGPGSHAVALQQSAVIGSVMCLDLSYEMVKICKQRSLCPVNADLEHLPFATASFDGAWAFASLLHLARPAVRTTIQEIARVLRPGGLVSLAMKEGRSGGFEDRPDDLSGALRWFTYFSDRSLRRYFPKDRWELLFFERTSLTSAHPFLNYIYRKRD